MKNIPSPGDRLVMEDSYCLFITSVNITKGEGTFKLFEDGKTADDWHHSISLAQVPEWHKEHCDRCKV